MNRFLQKDPPKIKGTLSGWDAEGLLKQTTVDVTHRGEQFVAILLPLGFRRVEDIEQLPKSRAKVVPILTGTLFKVSRKGV